MTPPSSSPASWLASRVGRASGGPDPDRDAVRRLGTFCLVLAVAFGVTIPLRALGVSLSKVELAGVWVGNGVGLVATLSAGSMYWITRRSHMPARRILTLGLALEVALCLALSLTEQILTPLDTLPPRLSYAAILILTFPVVAPATLGRRALTTFLSASTVPVTTLVLWAVELTTARVPFVFFNWTAIYFVAGVALATSRIVHRLALDARRAQQLGSYHLERKIGGGGMGEVWQARHEMLVRPAAIKLIRADRYGSETEQAQRRFEREAQATSALRSPHTVQLYDFGVTPEGTLYYAMELLEGMDLERFVERFGPLRAPRAVYFLKQVCRSLVEAHSVGLLHRDIKPANLFTCRLGAEFDHIKVLDFGLVRPQLQSKEHKLSAAHVATGTPTTMPPELAMGDDDLDGRTDLYSVGCVGYWLLTGQLVFEETSPMKMLMAHVSKQPEPPSTRAELPVPPELDAIIMSCLAKDRSDRPASARELFDALDALVFDEPWTESRARAWWQAHLPDLAAPHAAPTTREAE